MKVSFIHTGDIHLGRQFHFKYDGDAYGSKKRSELWKSFKNIVTIAEQNSIDLLLIAGDLFDSDETDLSVAERAADLLGKLSRTKVVIIAGNHDFQNPLSVYEMIEWPGNVVILHSGKMESVYFQSLNTEVFGLSWQKDTYRDMPYKGRLDLAEDRNNILLLHGDAYHKESDYMPLDLNQFDDFDYVALGHYHKMDQLRENMAYCGSPEALNFGEDGEHGILAGQIEDHSCRTEFVSMQGRCFVTRDIEIRPEMSMDQIIDCVLKIDSDEKRAKNYYRIRFTGFCDIDLDREWLFEELIHHFYYLETDDTRLEADLDIDAVLEANADNVIGAFIREMQQKKDDPVAKRALMIVLRGLLKEGLTFNEH